MSESVTCGATIKGPRMGRNVVLWVKYCTRKTRHPSGRCLDHRTGTEFGPGVKRR